MLSRIGALLSPSTPQPTTSKQSTDDSMSSTLAFDIDSIPDDVWMEVFLRCDHATLCRVEASCRLFCSLLRSQEFWVQRAIHEGYGSGAGTMLTLPSLEWRQLLQSEDEKEMEEEGDQSPSRCSRHLDYRRICVKRPFNNNLIPPIKDTDTVRSLEEERGWRIEHGGNNLILERPPVGCEQPDHIPVCLATSFNWCQRYIEVDLVDAGIDPWILDFVRPRITVREWNAARGDCGAEYQLRAQLLRSDEMFDRNVKLPRFRLVEKSVDQWQGGAWEESSIVFDEYPIGMRKIGIMSSGKDRHFWHGHYGYKFANTELVVEFPKEVRLKEPDEFAEPERVLLAQTPPRIGYSLRMPFGLGRLRGRP